MDRLKGNLKMRVLRFSIFGVLLGATACGNQTQGPNSFLALTETLGVSAAGNDNTNVGGTGGGIQATTTFRRSMSVMLANHSDAADLNVSLLGWVNPSS